MIGRPLYSALLYLAALPAVAYLACTPRHRQLIQRFYIRRRNKPVAAERVRIWIHAASLGEVNTAAPYIDAIRTRWPGNEILLTVSTVSGMEQAQRLDTADYVAWCPFDVYPSIGRFLDMYHPTALILIETEIWPNLIHAAASRLLPTAIVNGRLSEKHFLRYLRIPSLIRSTLSAVRHVCAQTEIDAERFAQLGMPPDRISVVGNSKFDGALRSIPGDIIRRLRDAYKLDSTVPIVVFGSTRPGDERRALRAQRVLMERGIPLQLVLVPRHVDRCGSVLEELDDAELLLHSACLEADAVQELGTERALLVDTMGELAHFYAIADVAVIGGSFSEEVQGHNPIEPAALGVPAVFGPCMKNFRAPAQILADAGAAIQVATDEELADQLAKILDDPAMREKMSRAAREAVDHNTGAIEQNLEILDPIFDVSESGPTQGATM